MSSSCDMAYRSYVGDDRTLARSGHLWTDMSEHEKPFWCAYWSQLDSRAWRIRLSPWYVRSQCEGNTVAHEQTLVARIRLARPMSYHHFDCWHACKLIIGNVWRTLNEKNAWTAKRDQTLGGMRPVNLTNASCHTMFLLSEGGNGSIWSLGYK